MKGGPPFKGGGLEHQAGMATKASAGESAGVCVCLHTDIGMCVQVIVCVCTCMCVCAFACVRACMCTCIPGSCNLSCLSPCMHPICVGTANRVQQVTFAVLLGLMLLS